MSGEEAYWMDRIAEMKDVSALPALTNLLCSRTGAISEAAAEVIERIVARCTLKELTGLDRQIRQTGDWQSMHLSWVKKVAESRAEILGVLSCHRSGYVREAAVDELLKVKSPLAIPFLLMRLNDWVGPVGSGKV